MNNSTLFTKAHALTKATIQAGDSYHAVFGACLKHILARTKKAENILSELTDKTSRIDRLVIKLSARIERHRAMMVSGRSSIYDTLYDVEGIKHGKLWK